MMNFSTNALGGSHASKENIPASSKIDAPPQVQRAKQRRVLGVLSENEQHGRSSLSQGSHFSKPSSLSDSSQLAFLGCSSTSNYDVYVEEASEVVLAASGQEEISNSCYPDVDTAALQHEDLRLLLELSSSSCQDASMQSDKSLMSEEVLCVSEYAEDIHLHLRESEMRTRPKPGYLERHPEITNGMRVILVDWLVEVVQEYKLRSETLHLAVNYLDRFLSCTAGVKRGKLQLVGTAALMIAAKYEEILPPELNEYVYTTDNTYTKQQLVRMEHVFLRVLAFKMVAPTTNQFLRLFMSIHSVCADTENLALYVAELSLLEIDPFLQYTPSIVAAGAYCLATYIVNRSFWPDSLHAFTGYPTATLVPCVTDLHKLYMSAENHPQQAIREKYKSSKYCGVSLITAPAVLPFYK
ncbi:cyclin-A1 [Pseudoliparis swirei]|uniref:cyclin-A1 n=1 Tax=Pseudoliparis swirei TaxID=2059687 RepID=UPI0024BE16FD|nr:cyclin-A1 [Pseudoliparis swirei]